MFLDYSAPAPRDRRTPLALAIALGGGVGIGYALSFSGFGFFPAWFVAMIVLAQLASSVTASHHIRTSVAATVAVTLCPLLIGTVREYGNGFHFAHSNELRQVAICEAVLAGIAVIVGLVIGRGSAKRAERKRQLALSPRQ